MSLVGILFYVGGLWVLSALDVTGKVLAALGLPVLLICWFRYLAHVLVVAMVVLPRRGRALFHTRSLWRQLQRGGLMILTTVLFFSLLARAPLAEATALSFFAPLFMLALAPWLLREGHRAHRWLGAIVGFLGMLIVVRPGGQLSPSSSALGALTALSFACLNISTRRVAHDDPLTTNLYGGLTGMVALTVALPFFWRTPQLEAWQWALLASMGVTGFLGQWLQISGFKLASASLLAPFMYLQILSAAFFGWFVFRQLPDPVTAAGIVLICAAGLCVAVFEGRRLPHEAGSPLSRQGRSA